MSDATPWLGTVRVRDKHGETVYPLGSAEMGITRYADRCELWLYASADPPPGKPDADDGSLPGGYASIFVKRLAAEELPGKIFSIPGYQPDYDQPRTTFGYHVHDDNFAGGTITVTAEPGRGDAYRVTWAGTTDYYSGAMPDDELAFEIDGVFRFRGVKEIPRSLKYMMTNPLLSLAAVRVPVGGVIGLLAGLWLDPLGPCAGVAAGAFLGLLWTYASWSAWERDVRRLAAPGPPEKV